jgi:hypothetical protein
MERLEVEVRKKTTLFVSLATVSALLFVAPLLTKPEYFYLSALGVGLALLAIAAYVFGPKEKKVIAEVVGNTLRIESMKHPWFGIGAPYLSHPHEIDLQQVTRIVTMYWQQSQVGASSYMYLGIHTEKDTKDVFVDIAYHEKLDSFLRSLSAMFPSIAIERTP